MPNATLMDGAALAARMREEIKQEVAELGHVGLATVLVGDDPASFESRSICCYEIAIRMDQHIAVRQLREQRRQRLPHRLLAEHADAAH